MRAKVLLVDDHKLLRQGLRALLERECDLEVIGEAANGHEALQLVRQLTPDIVIMDIGMPGLNGIDASRRIKTQNKKIHIIALSMHADRRSVNSMLSAQASGYVLKSAAVEELTKAIRAVRNGQIFTSSKVTNIVVEDYVRQLENRQPPPESPLTPREREILQQISEGRGTKDIASQLHLSANTVDTHRRRIKQKLGLHSVASLTKFAISEGLTTLDT